MRRSLSFVMALLVLLTLAGTALAVTGRIALVETHGVSMQPSYVKGDLALVTRRTSYQRGDVAAYRPQQDGLVVLHRIVGGNGTGFTFKGDNNTHLDAHHPTADALIGKVVLHVPQGGVWLHRVTGPIPLTAFLLILLTGGRQSLRTHRHRRRRNVSRHVNAGRTGTSITALSPALQATALGSSVIALIGAVLAVAAWSSPTTQPVTVTRSVVHTMAFSYSTPVPRSPAYDGTTASSPSPIFRRLADSVNLRVSYRGGPGRIAVVADLATASGWRSTVPLSHPAAFDGNKYVTNVRLELSPLARRAAAAAAATGLPDGPITIVVRAVVTSPGGDVFAPAVALMLSPLQLSLVSDASSLIVTKTINRPGASLQARTIGIGGHELPASSTRPLSLALILLGLAGTSAVLMQARRHGTDEGGRIRRGHGRLLLRVHPIASRAGSRDIDVAEFATMVRLAERYGLLILHWSRSGVETFIIQDESTTYRYRTGTPASHVDTTPALAHG
ncbi:MAG: signal peptidase I [Frankiaceae bacterium]|nr:signal peptidase I [Frankiaceae bacterium]